MLSIPILDLGSTAVSIYLENMRQQCCLAWLPKRKFIHTRLFRGSFIGNDVCFSSLLVLLLLLNNWWGGEKAVCTSIKVGLLVIFTFWWEITRFFHLKTLKPSISNHLREKKIFLSGIMSSYKVTIWEGLMC